MKPILFSTPMVRAIQEGRKTMTRRVVKPQPVSVMPGVLLDKCPIKKYHKGDILWVRETWTKSDGSELPAGYYYRADRKSATIVSRWKPSIHMPHEAARLFLRITDVRVERLQDITEGDARAKGFETDGDEAAKISFSRLWDYFNAKRGYSWDSNPWVYVISFERVSKEAAE